MKRYILLLLTLWMALKPLWPLAEYVINYEYIATVLCENREVPEMKCNGKCYLSKMLAEQQAQDQENPFETPLVKADPNPIIIQEIRRFLFSRPVSGSDPTRKFWGDPRLHSSLFVFELVQPPEGQSCTPGPIVNG